MKNSLFFRYSLEWRVLVTNARQLENPRKEDAENELDVSNEKFCNLGLSPITLEGTS